MLTPSELIAHLGARGETLAFAESLTGGLLCADFVAVPGASVVVRGAIVAYATDLKAALLGVDAELLAERGAVNPTVAEQMAIGVRDRLGATYGVSTTGVAGPEPQDSAAVGTVYVAVASQTMVISRLLSLSGDRAEIRSGAVRGAVATLGENVVYDT